MYQQLLVQMKGYLNEMKYIIKTLRKVNDETQFDKQKFKNKVRGGVICLKHIKRK